MPRFPNQVLDCVIYLYRSVEEAQAGDSAGGSGFLAAVPYEQDRNFGLYYAVTASHVVHEQEGGAPVIRLNTRSGGADVLPTGYDNWAHHPDGDDVAVCPIGVSDDYHQFGAIGVDVFITHEVISTFDIGPGDEVFFSGRFGTHGGKQQNLPSLRFGNLSMMPVEPIRHPTRGYKQNMFLVEARSLSGYSGSPVFVYIPPMAWRGGRPLEPKLHLSLLGIDTGHLSAYSRILESDRETAIPEDWWVRHNTGMATVLPAWKIREVLEVEELAEHRKASEQEWLDERRRQTDAVLDTEAGEEFTRDTFETALKKVSRRIKPSQPAEGTSET